MEFIGTVKFNTEVFDKTQKTIYNMDIKEELFFIMMNELGEQIKVWIEEQYGEEMKYKFGIQECGCWGFYPHSCWKNSRPV